MPYIPYGLSISTVNDRDIAPMPTVVSPQLAVAGIKTVAGHVCTVCCSMVDHRHFALALLCSFTRARAQGSETEFNSGKRVRAKKEAHVPLNLDGLVRAPARSISLVPANDVPSRISLAGKLQQRLQLLG